MRGRPPVRPVRLLAVAQFTQSVGDGAFYACSALFFTQVLGLSAFRVGLALTVAWAGALVAGIPLGNLADRWGPRRTALLLSVATAGTLGGVMAVRSFPFFLLLVCGYACCQAGLASARQTLLARWVTPGERTRVRARLQATLNAGLAIGAGLGALALGAGSRRAHLAVFALDAVCFLAAALVLRRLPADRTAPVQVPEATTTRWRRGTAVLRDRRYVLVTALHAVMCLNMPLLSLGLPLWIAQRTAAPASTAAVLLLVNMLAVVVFQVRVARRVTGPGTAVRATRQAGLLMTAACGVYALSSAGGTAWTAVAVLLAAAVIQVGAEMLYGAGSWEIGFGMADAGRMGQYQGLFAMAPQVARALGPVLLSVLLLEWGTAGWLVLGGLFLAAGSAFGPVVRRAGAAAPGRAPVGERPRAV